MQVSFIIPLYNRCELSRACLDSLLATVPRGLAFEVLLVDNASTDETGAWLDTLRDPVRAFRQETNLGYAAANNLGARAARGEFLVLLNSDLVLSPGWLEPMLEAAAAHPRSGLVGNIQLRADNGHVDHAGITFVDGGYPLHWREPLDRARAAGTREFPAVTAACAVVRRSWFLATGGFDERYVNGFEDVDLCLRARAEGRANLVVGASVVRHHVSASDGRGRREFNNAALFLRQWGPRTRVLEIEWARAQARAHSLAAARDYFRTLRTAPWRFRPALVAQHRAVRRSARAAARTAAAPVVVAIDLERMQPGTGHGGIKPAFFGLWRALATQRTPRLRFAVFARPELRPELSPYLRRGDVVAGSERDTPADAGAQVLWCPFGQSRHRRPDLPSVSWVVDILHRDLPNALPPEEVNFREQWFQAMVREATFFQCNSRHVIARLGELYGVEPSRCFHTYQPIQSRLPPPGPLPGDFPAGPFFLYPANYWPHKNHETLLLAYRAYRRAAGDAAWPLVLTGHPDAREARIREMTAALGLADAVRIAGHVADDQFSAIWARAGALVFPSLHEGFGIPPLEAMQFGVPVLAADNTSLPEVGGDACLYFDPVDTNALAAALERLTRDAGLRAELAARGRRRLAEFDLGLEADRLAHHLVAAARGGTP